MPTYYDPDTGQALEETAPSTYYNPDTGEVILSEVARRMPVSSGGATAALTGPRAVPGVIKAGARFAANHPAAVQKGIGAGISTAASGAGAVIGNMLGGPVGAMGGAVAGGGLRGMTPAQTDIRRVAGRLAGEAPAVADDAARALAIQHYAKETAGVRLNPTDIITKPTGSHALKA